MPNNDKFPIAIPFGSGGNKELIQVVKDREKSYLNTIGKSRFTIEDGTDIAILLDIGAGDKGTIEFIESLCAASFAEDGRSRGEHIMITSGTISVPSMPGANHDTKSPQKIARKDKSRDNGHNSEYNNE